MDHSEHKDHKVTFNSRWCHDCLPLVLQHSACCTSYHAWYMVLAGVHHLSGLHVQIASQSMNGGAPFNAGQYSFFDSMGDDGGLEGGLDGGLDELEGGLEVKLLNPPLYPCWQW